jgi:hypothetical protein
VSVPSIPLVTLSESTDTDEKNADEIGGKKKKKK